MPDRYTLLLARAISTVFTPFYLPTVAFVVLMQFSYLKLMPLPYKVRFILIVFLFTVLFPRIIIFIYRQLRGLKSHELSMREQRYVPYVISIVCYAMLLFILERYRMPHYTVSIVSASLLIQIICALVNHNIKVSLHAAASGGVIGMLIAFSLIFHFNAFWWVALCVLLCGCVCSARMVLRQHNYQELFFGVLIGIVSGWGAVLYL